MGYKHRMKPDGRFCLNCFYFDYECVKYDCDYLIKINSTHIWKDFSCKICGIGGWQLTRHTNNYFLYTDRLYSCNEYLMLRANE